MITNVIFNGCILELYNGATLIKTMKLNTLTYTINEVGSFILNDGNTQSTITSCYLGLATFKTDIDTAINTCLNSSVVPPTQVLTDQVTLSLSIGLYTKADVLTQAVTAGYAGGKTKVESIQFISAKSGFYFSSLGMTPVYFPQASQNLHKGNGGVDEASDFEINVEDTTIALLVLY